MHFDLLTHVTGLYILFYISMHTMPKVLVVDAFEGVLESKVTPARIVVVDFEYLIFYCRYPWDVHSPYESK